LRQAINGFNAGHAAQSPVNLLPWYTIAVYTLALHHYEAPLASRFRANGRTPTL